MADLDDRLRLLDRLEAPDLWPEVRTRLPPAPPGDPQLRVRLVAAVVALLVSATGIAFGVRAFLGHGERGRPVGIKPSPTSLPISSWEIAFTRGDGGGAIYSVRGDGSSLRRLVDGSQPTWSPDGASFAFVGAVKPGATELDVASADGSNVTTLTTLTPPPGVKPTARLDDVHPAWSPDGEQILLGSWGGLSVMMADGSDITTLIPWGGFVIYVQPAWSPDGEHIAMIEGTDAGVVNLIVATSDGANRDVVATDIDFRHRPSEPNWSPDGTRIAFAAGPANGDQDIWTVGPDGSGEVDLTNTPDVSERDPSWSPDGEWIAFSGPDGLYVMRSDGTSRTRITSDPSDASPTWRPMSVHAGTPTPGGSGSATLVNGEIWARIGGGDGPAFVYSVQPDGSGQTLLFSDGRDPDWPPATVNRDAIGEDYAWSPDGSKVAFLNYSGYDDVQGEHSSIFVMNPDGTDRVQLTPDGELDSGPSWSPDGSRIAFASDREGPYPYEVGCWASTLCPSDIYVVNADGSGEIRLTDDPADDSQPSWSPDGTRIAFRSRRDDPSGDIYVMNTNGTGVTRLTTDPDWKSNPRWSPDGTKIAFIGLQHAGGVDVYVMDPDGSNVMKLTDFQDNSFAQDLEWSPDGTKIAFATDPGEEMALFVMNPDGSGVQELAGGAGTIAWRPVPG